MLRYNTASAGALLAFYRVTEPLTLLTVSSWV